MSVKEQERLEVYGRVKRGELKLTEAAELVKLSYRQVRRSYQRWEAEGNRGLVHQGRGRPSNRGYPAEFREAALALYQERYAGWGPTFAAEKLAAAGYAVDHETLRGWLLAAKLWRVKHQRSPHRSWRERRAHFGELVQLDGSHHRWFEERAGRSCLMKMVDDATGKRLAYLAEEETTFAAMRLLWNWIDRYGIPRALYTDKKNVYVLDEKTRQQAEESGAEALSQFGRACKKLGIEIITAHSPQAKGRVERSHRVYQDRLVKELSLQQATTIDQANELLAGDFGQDLATRHAVVPRAAADYHRSAAGWDLAAIFCLEDQRSITPDWVVRFHNQYFQLTPPQPQARGRGTVIVQQRLDGSLHFLWEERELAYVLLPARPEPATPSARRPPTSAGPKTKWVPASDHPWRRYREPATTPPPRS